MSFIEERSFNIRANMVPESVDENTEKDPLLEKVMVDQP